uniref:Uncharacterized protein n=1 Tax=Glossina pallidipes TaxID=7398 RepID=A0A1A9Z906_GLOPL
MLSLHSGDEYPIAAHLSNLFFVRISLLVFNFSMCLIFNCKRIKSYKELEFIYMGWNKPMFMILV